MGSLKDKNENFSASRPIDKHTLLEFVRRCNIHVAKYTALELSLIEVGLDLICDAYELLCCGMPVNLGSIFEFAIEHHIRLTNELPSLASASQTGA